LPFSVSASGAFARGFWRNCALGDGGVSLCWQRYFGAMSI
jgi:hypothetical protein